MLEDYEKQRDNLFNDVSLLAFYSNNTISWIDAWEVTSEDRLKIIEFYSKEIDKQNKSNK